MLDWELCTLGDPLADVGYLGVYWYDGNTAMARANDPTPAGGFPAYTDLVERYARRTGRDVSRHRLLRRLRVLASGRDQRRGLCPIHRRSDG